MATDGVKIIDGDTAHDTYEGIMDLYDSRATIETVRSKNPFRKPTIMTILIVKFIPQRIHWLFGKSDT